MSTIASPSSGQQVAPGRSVSQSIIHDVIDHELPPALAGRCTYCGGAVSFGPVVLSYPTGTRPAWLLHGICFAALEAHYAELPARIAELLSPGGAA